MTRLETIATRQRKGLTTLALFALSVGTALALLATSVGPALFR